MKKFRRHVGSSGHICGSTGCLCCFTSTAVFALYSPSFPCLLPCSHSVSLSRPRSRRHLSMTRHSARPLMSQFLTSRLMLKRRPFLLIAVTILISRCAHVPSRWPRRQHPSLRHWRACQFRRIHRDSCVRCPLVRMSSAPISQSALPACRPV